jgi:hypothetical protein
VEPGRAAAWRHLGAREGFEVAFLRPERDGRRLEGHATGVEDGEAWGVRYDLGVDGRWATRSALVFGLAAQGSYAVRLEGDGAGRWLVDGVHAPELDGCLDVDLEASASTNCLPVRRLALAVGERAEAPAVYVRAADLAVERLEQSYTRLDGRRYDYSGPAFGYRAVLAYDEHGLVRDYPGIAARVL